MADYQQIAEDFCKRNGVKVTISFSDVCQKWNGTRNHYKVRIDRNGKSMRVDFYDSINNFEKSMTFSPV